MRSSHKTIAALDIGSSKIACLIVEQAGKRQERHVSGFGFQPAEGIKGGVVFDACAAEQSIRAAVDKAERLAGQTIDEVHVCLNGGRIQSHNYGAKLEIAGARIKESHIEVLLRKGWQHVAHSDDAILHAQQIGFALDGAGGIDNPMGYRGQHLFADFHVVSADLGHVRQLLSCIEDSYLSPASVIAAPYAGALGVLRQKEAQEGVVVIDLGGGTSSLAVFAHDRFIMAASLAKGGQQITGALARQFGLDKARAEQLKLHVGRQGDEENRAFLHPTIPQADELVRRQMTGIFLHQKKQMIDVGFPLQALKYIVLTGGGSLYYNASRLAAEIFGLPTRIGASQPFPGVPSQLLSPAFAALWGILAYQDNKPLDLAERFAGPLGKTGKGSFARLGNWLHRLAE